jgi:hypothetical protein
MLVQLALIVFGLFGILAAIVDMGFVRLTQVQMQVAADSAAMEGLRARDSQPDGAGSIDGFRSDCMRRLIARDLVQWTFDDDFNLSEDARSFGAGPNVKFTDGVDTLSAYQFMSVPATDDPDPAFRGGRTFKPYLQLNQSANAAYGDMVSGSFNPDGGALVGADGQPIAGLYEYGAHAPDHQEYDRTDFAAGAPIPDPMMTGDCERVTPSVSTPITDSSFLVRLRRTNVQNDPDLDNTEGVSSRGTGLPLLFGRGTLIQDNPDPDAYQPRRDGITVRATAIANARPALRVGGSQPNLRGAAPFLLTLDFFRMLGTTSTSATIDATGAISSGGSTVGRFVMDPMLVNTVGRCATDVCVPAAASVACDPVSTNVINEFTPVVGTIGAAATPRIIGFGVVTLSWPDCTTSPSSITLSRAATPFVAPGNATVSLDSGLPSDIPPSDIGPLFDAVRMFAGQAGVVLAPALVR